MNYFARLHISRRLDIDFHQVSFYLFSGKFVGMYPIPANTKDPVDIISRNGRIARTVPITFLTNYEEAMTLVNNGKSSKM